MYYLKSILINENVIFPNGYCHYFYPESNEIIVILSPQINLQRKMRVTGVITQGAKRIGSPEYIKSYKIAYSNDGKTWAMYKVKSTNEDMVRLTT